MVQRPITLLCRIVKRRKQLLLTYLDISSGIEFSDSLSESGMDAEGLFSSDGSEDVIFEDAEDADSEIVLEPEEIFEENISG